MSALLVPPQKISDYNRLVEDIFYGKPLHKGEVGIEIEVEGRGLPRAIPSYWEFHEEPSLRGEHAEYVLARPVRRSSVGSLLVYLQKKLKEASAVIHDSQRTSVHVHINVQGLYIRQVYNLLVLYTILEDIFAEYAGEDRIGNLFCLRAKDAEFWITKLRKDAKDDTYNFTDQTHLRYTAVNVCALPKFNSLEFRSLRGTIDPTMIKNWVFLLLALKDASLKYSEPREIIRDFSLLGAAGFSYKVIPPELRKLLNLGGDLTERLLPSMRLAQELAYATDWRLQEKPFRERLFGPQAKKKIPVNAMRGLEEEDGDEVNPVPAPRQWDNEEAFIPLRRR